MMAPWSRSAGSRRPIYAAPRGMARRRRGLPGAGGGAARLIVEGRLPPYTRLPSERELAAALGVSRNTVTAALDVLRDQRYLASRRAGAAGSPRLPPRATVPMSRAASRRHDRPHVGQPARAAGPRRAALHAAHAPRSRSSAATAMSRSDCPHARRIAGYLSGVGSPPTPARCWSPRAPCTPGTSRCARSPVPATASCWRPPPTPARLDAVRAHGASRSACPWPGRLGLAAAARGAPRRPTVLGYLIPDFQNPTGYWASAASAPRSPARPARPGCCWSAMRALPSWSSSRATPRTQRPAALARRRGPGRRRARRRIAVQAGVGRPAHRLAARRAAARSAAWRSPAPVRTSAARSSIS